MMPDMIAVVQAPPPVNEVGNDDGLLSKEEVEQIIQYYEQKYQMSSEDFLRHYGDEEMVPDCFDTMDWSILLESR